MSWGNLLMRVWAIAATHDPDAITANLAAVHSDRWSIPATGPPTESPELARAAA